MMGYKLHKKVRTLTQAVPPECRPRCGNCGKKLKPETSLRFLGASPHVEGDMLLPIYYAPTSTPLPWKELLGIYYLADVPVVMGASPNQWGTNRPIESIGEEVRTYYAHVTTGAWVGFSGGRETEVPFFCSQPCAHKFGCLMYQAGYRRKGINETKES